MTTSIHIKNLEIERQKLLNELTDLKNQIKQLEKQYYLKIERIHRIENKLNKSK